ncbi:hypothetical protein [Azospirillum sp.]|uniref:hypothetical protein n=1 Tax=Azospirillum sp. TaxID=34012 RepID=UPI003D7280AF
MDERAEGDGADLPVQVWEAVLGVAAAAAGRKEGREAIAGLARHLSEVPGCDELAMRLAMLTKLSTQEFASLKGWVGVMHRGGKLTDTELRAARDIGRGIEQAVVVVADGLRAVDPSRLVVDGGKLPTFSLGGMTRTAPEVARVEAWRAEVRERPAMRAVVRGSHGKMPVDALVLRVLVEGVAPRRLDAELGLKHGRAQQAVLSELRTYARMHFSA